MHAIECEEATWQAFKKLSQHYGLKMEVVLKQLLKTFSAELAKNPAPYSAVPAEEVLKSIEALK